MAAPEPGFAFALSVDDFDTKQLPPHARTPGADAFAHEVSEFFQREFSGFEGRVEIVVDSKQIRVSWHSEADAPTLMQVIEAKLEKSEFEEAIRLLEKLRRYRTEDFAILLNLGMALSDAGRYAEAEHHLRRAVELDPAHVNAKVALGVSLIRQNRHDEAVEFLQEAVTLGPANPWAYRNLSVCLARANRLDEAEVAFRRAIELSPGDQQAHFGLAQVLQAKGELHDADECFRIVIELDPKSSIAALARAERTSLAETSFRSAAPGSERPDAVMYCLAALKLFEPMAIQQVQKIGFEIGMLGQKGLDSNDVEQKFQLKSVPGEFNGLQLICNMYVAFKKFAPDRDIGFDLAKEFAAAKGMFEQKKG